MWLALSLSLLTGASALSPSHDIRSSDVPVIEMNIAQASPQGSAGLEATEGDALEDTDDGFWARFFPWWLDEELHPAIEENLITIWLANIFPGGFIWAPYIIAGELPGEQYYVEAVFAFTLHVLLLTPAALVMFVPVVGVLLLYGWMGANYLVLMPVASINALNRALKRRDAERGEPKAPPRGAALHTGHSTTAVQPAAFAY